MTRGLAVEWAGDNICVNSIAPGWFKSKMLTQVADPAREQKILSRMPLHAYGDTRDLGAMARFLCGPGAGYITGQDFAVDGGHWRLGINSKIEQRFPHNKYKLDTCYTLYSGILKFPEIKSEGDWYFQARATTDFHLLRCTTFLFPSDFDEDARQM